MLLHHGHVESVLSDKNPLLGVIIYDSCRDDPKEYIKECSTHRLGSIVHRLEMATFLLTFNPDDIFGPHHGMFHTQTTQTREYIDWRWPLSF